MSGNEGIGHNHMPGGADRLRDIFERLRRLDEEIKGFTQDRADLMSVARAEGYDVKVIRLVMQRSGQNPEDLKLREELVKMYEDVLSSIGGKQ